MFALLCVLLSLSSPSAGAQQPPLPPDAIAISEYPLEPGEFWRYRTSISEPDASGRVMQRSGITEVRVLTRNRRGQLSVAALSRVQSGNSASEEFFFLVADSSHIYSFSDPTRLRTALLDGPSSLDPGDAELQFPLAPGKRWGHPDMLNRTDGLYVNVPGPAGMIDLPRGRLPAIPIEFRTLPDQMTTWISPDIGVVRYEYVHHGSGTREVRELVEFGHAGIDTAAIARAMEQAFNALAATGNFWARRSIIAHDPVFEALLGPITPGEVFDVHDGERRASFHAARSTLVLEQVADGSAWASILRWKNRGGLIKAFLRPSGDAPVPGDEEISASGSAQVPRLEKSLADARDGLAKARQLLDADRDVEAGGLAEAAMDRVTDGLTAILPGQTGADSPEQIKEMIRQEAGSHFLTTRYGRRVRIDDGSFRVSVDTRSNLFSVEVVLNGSSATPVGAAPRIIRPGPRGLEVSVLGRGDPTAAVRRILMLDWSAVPESQTPASSGILVWNAPGPARTASIDLFQFERSDGSGAVRRTWQKLLPSGSARLLDPPSRLEVEFAEPDPDQPALSSRWREIYAAPASVGEDPPLLFRDTTNPWIRTVAELMTALRAHDAAAVAGFVQDASLLDRLSATWLADASVSLVEARSTAPAPGGVLDNNIVSIDLVRSELAPPAEAGPEILRLKLALSGERWMLVDVTPGPAAAWDQ